MTSLPSDPHAPGVIRRIGWALAGLIACNGEAVANAPPVGDTETVSGEAPANTAASDPLAHCRLEATVCDAFERDALLPFAGWREARGAPRLEAGGAFSGAHSLAVQVAPGHALPSLTTGRDVSTSGGEHHLALQLSAAHAPSGRFTIARLASGSGPDDETVELLLDATGLSVSARTTAAATGIERVLLPASALFGSGWHRVVVHASSDLRTWTLRTGVDGKDGPRLELPSSAGEDAKVQLDLGLVEGEASTAWDGLLFDDVVFY